MYGFQKDIARADINVELLTKICEQKSREPLDSQPWEMSTVNKKRNINHTKSI